MNTQRRNNNKYGLRVINRYLRNLFFKSTSIENIFQKLNTQLWYLKKRKMDVKLKIIIGDSGIKFNRYKSNIGNILKMSYI